MQSKEEMTLASGIKDPDENWREEVASEAKSRHALNETLIFIQEAVEKASGPDSAPLTADEAALIDDAKAKVNEVIRGVDPLLEGIHSPMLRNELLLTINDSLVFAYILGNYSTPSESIWKLHGSQHRNQQIKPAIKARKEAGGVQKLIERLANDLWSRKPDFKGNSKGTAETIQPAFNRELAQLEKIPKAWQPADWENPDSVKKEIDRIRKRVASMDVPDNQRSSS
jgi:hypothetical protein